MASCNNCGPTIATFGDSSQHVGDIHGLPYKASKGDIHIFA